MLEPWYVENLVCPVDKTYLKSQGKSLECGEGHCYPVVSEVPIMLLDSFGITIGSAKKSLEASSASDDPYFVETLGLTDKEIFELKEHIKQKDKIEGFEIDPVARFLMAATNGYLYRGLQYKLQAYPIPELPLSDGAGKTLLDVGCGWGRWSFAGATKHYNCIGIDPSLGAILAAKRIAKQLGLKIKFIVGDARHLPFRDGFAEQVFSYSVLQHFSKADCAAALTSVARVLKPHGKSLIQMPNKFGIRSLQHQISRGRGEPGMFGVRYWSLRELQKCFSDKIGKSNISIDGFFGLGVQKSKEVLLPLRYELLIKASSALKKISRALPFLKHCADSVYIESEK